MPVKVLWLEGNSVPREFAQAGIKRVYRVVSYNGQSTDFLSGADAAQLAFALQNEEHVLLGLPLDEQ